MIGASRQEQASARSLRRRAEPGVGPGADGGRRRGIGLLCDDRGGVIVFTAVGLAAMLGMVALGVEIGMLFAARSEAQRAADSAALAGASAFMQYDPKIYPDEADTTARNRAIEYATLNTIQSDGIVEAEVYPEVLLAEYKVRVTVRREAVPLSFARILGVTSWPVSAQAAAVAANASKPASCIKPFAIPDMWHEVLEDENDNRIMDFGVQENAGGGGAFAGGGGPGGRSGRDGGTGPNEVWSYDAADGDWYDPEITGLGTNYRNGFKDVAGNEYMFDEGRRFPMKFQQPGQGGSPSNWQALDLRPPEGLDGDEQGRMKFYMNAIQNCITAEHLNVSGQVRTMTGQFPVNTRDAIDSLLAKDPDAYWDDEENKVAYPPDSDSPYAPHNTGDPESWRNSPRVFTTVVIGPFDVYPGNHMMDIRNFAQFFLEDPAREYPGTNPPHHAPITGRLVRNASGGLVTGPETGTLIKVLRLVE